MLQQVLHALEAASGPLSLDELSRQLGIERSALEGMIDFWVRKGRLRERASGCSAAGPGCSCSTAPNGCVFDRGGPRTISVQLLPRQHEPSAH